jgi:predicted nucleic acid-binding protein
VLTILVDTGVLLRAFDRSSPVQKTIFRALRKRWIQGDRFVTSHQNIAEFWNVATRPASARGGFGLSVDETLKRVQTIEKLGMVLPFTNACLATIAGNSLDHRGIGSRCSHSCNYEDAWNSSPTHFERSRLPAIQWPDGLDSGLN